MPAHGRSAKPSRLGTSHGRPPSLRSSATGLGRRYGECVEQGHRAGVALRWSRAAGLAAVAAAFAALAHATAGGTLPGWRALAVLFGLTTAVFAGLLGRPASTLRVVALLVGGQAVLHGVFTASGGHGSTHRVTSAATDLTTWAAVPRGRLADVLVAPGSLDSAPTQPSVLSHAVAHLTADLASPTTQLMALAHLVAAVALGVWLAAGERLAWRLVILLAGPAAAALAAAARMGLALAVGCVPGAGAVDEPVRVPRWRLFPVGLHGRLLAHAAPRRGPPVAPPA